MPPFKLQRTATPTVKPFLRDFKSPVLGGLLEGQIQCLGAVRAKIADDRKKMYRLAFLMEIIVHKREKITPLRQRKCCPDLLGVIKKKPSRRTAILVELSACIFLDNTQLTLHIIA